MGDVVGRFWALCGELDEVLQGPGDQRPLLAEVLELVRSAPEAREEFVACFREVVRGRGPWEVASFCMRRLKWPEIYEEATEELRASHDPRAWNVLDHIRKAYEESPDGDFFD